MSHGNLEEIEIDALRKGGLTSVLLSSADRLKENREE